MSKINGFNANRTYQLVQEALAQKTADKAKAKAGTRDFSMAKAQGGKPASSVGSSVDKALQPTKDGHKGLGGAFDNELDGREDVRETLANWVGALGTLEYQPTENKCQDQYGHKSLMTRALHSRSVLAALTRSAMCALPLLPRYLAARRTFTGHVQVRHAGCSPVPCRSDPDPPRWRPRPARRT